MKKNSVKKLNSEIKNLKHSIVKININRKHKKKKYTTNTAYKVIIYHSNISS